MQPSNKAAANRGDRSRANGAPPSDARKRVVIADSDPLARRVIRAALQDEHDYAVPGEAQTSVEAVELCGYYKPDAALLETSLGNGLDGIVAARKIREVAPDTKILMFSREDRDDVQLAALAAGASGFVPKSAQIEEVVRGLELVIDGRAAIPPRTTMVLIQRLRMLPEGGAGIRPVRSVLTPREWEILDLLSQSFDTHAIAETLVLTEETVYSHVKNILRKLGVHSRREAVERARQLRDPLAGPKLPAEAAS
ncbi:MAG TPA: response regulator transcription factor [Solirubrobacterales bacterium]|jgi:DNA-binding NarL/FixJ family response regulator